MINGVSVSHPSSSWYIHVSQDSRSPDKFSPTKSVLVSVRSTRGSQGLQELSSLHSLTSRYTPSLLHSDDDSSLYLEIYLWYHGIFVNF